MKSTSQFVGACFSHEELIGGCLPGKKQGRNRYRNACERKRQKTKDSCHLEDCGYCAKARKALEELYAENPGYREVPIRMIEESREPELADQYDYYAVPSFFDGKEKLFEAHLFMSYEDIRDEVRRVLDYALSSPKAAEEL